jgi:phage terminase large subunit-like protein
VCAPRADRVVDVFERILVHTKGRWARTPFKLSPWQSDEIVRPLFGTVEYSGEWQAFVRAYRIAWLEVARKNGKSELLAGVALTLLVADDEEGAEVYGCAKDRDQARKVYDVAVRMVELCPTLSKRLDIYKQSKRIVDTKSGSYYEVVAADAAGNLGHNPHGIVFDEVISQPNVELWNAMRTAMGARTQPLMIAATTAGSDLVGFARQEHDYCEMVAAAPKRDPRRFVFIRTTPIEADWHDEAEWQKANPALGEFLSLEALRDEHREALSSPAKEQAFRQFRLNQWVRAESRWMPIDAWDATAGIVDEARLAGRRCFGGLDLAAVSDLTSLAWYFPPRDESDSAVILWRHFVPEAIVSRLDELTAGEFTAWRRAGFVTVTEGDVCDYDVVHDQIDGRRRCAAQPAEEACTSGWLLVLADLAVLVLVLVLCVLTAVLLNWAAPHWVDDITRTPSSTTTTQ